jgi:WXG100 family type VII secretion target
MTSGEIYVRISQMREVASTINRSGARVTESIEAVEREIRALSADRFMSVGAEVFRAEFYRLTPKLKEAFEMLTDFQDKLTAAADDIEAATRSIQS